MSFCAVEVVYALPDEQAIIPLDVPAGSTVMAVIERSGVLERYPQIDLTQHAVGIYGQRVTLETRVEPQDRVEIYRPLLIDPMEARLLRAQKQAQREKQRPARRNKPKASALPPAGDFS